MMFEIGQKVYFGGEEYQIIEISKDPYIKFDDGSRHYVLTIINNNGDFVYVNDAQIFIKLEDLEGCKINWK